MQHIDITALSVISGKMPIVLAQIGYTMWQVMDDNKKDVFRYVTPPETKTGEHLISIAQQFDPRIWPLVSNPRLIAKPHMRLLTVLEFTQFIDAHDHSGVESARTDPVICDNDWEKPLHPLIIDGLMPEHLHQEWSIALATLYAAWMTGLTGKKYRPSTEEEQSAMRMQSWHDIFPGTDRC